MCFVERYMVVHLDDAGDDVNGVLHIQLLSRGVSISIKWAFDISPIAVERDCNTKYRSSIPQLLLKFD